jgi:hypothetical protein
MRRPSPPYPVPIVIAVAVLAAACGPSTQAPAGSIAPAASAGSSVIPVVIGQYERGAARFVFSFLDQSGNAPVASPDRTAQVAFMAPGATDPGPAVTAEFVWAIEGARGEYIAHTEFPAAGAWKAVFVTRTPSTPQEAIGVGFDVQDQLPTVGIGDKAPATDTPTAADVGGDLSKISTDTSPDQRFYQLSVADALAQHRPFVLIFATPAFCQSAQCGPTLQHLKDAAATAPAQIAFLNVEPYQLTYTEGRLQPVLDANNQLQAVPAVEAWGILSEPWIFAVDGTGVVRASFEGIVTDAELQDAFKAIAGT